MRQLWRIVVGLLVVAVGLTAAPSDRAWACSCAEPTLDEMTDREPDAAVVRVRRIDPDGGTRGVGEVDEVLRGPAMPEQLPLALDDGGSCLPWVAVGDVAVLTFVPQGDGWRTMECGRLDPATGLDPVEVDPAASGPPSVALSGRFPGADLLLLDEELRILQATTLPGIRHGLRSCGDDLVVPRGGPGGESSLARLSLDGLELTAERSLSAGVGDEAQVIDVHCDAGRIDILALVQGAGTEVRVHRDVFGENETIDLGPAKDGEFADDAVVLLRETGDGEGFAMVHRDVSDADERVRFSLDGARGYDISVAPDAGHALVRGFDDDPLLVVVDLDTGREVARSTGWWQPVTHPWLGEGRILQIDEQAGGIGDSDGLAAYRVVDLQLTTVATLAPTPAWNLTAADGGFVAVEGDRVVVGDALGDAVRSTRQLWAGGVHDVVLLGEVVPDGEPPKRNELPDVDPTVARAAGSGVAGGGDEADVGGSGVASKSGLLFATAMTAAVALSTALLARRRRTRRFHDRSPQPGRS